MFHILGLDSEALTIVGATLVVSWFSVEVVRRYAQRFDIVDRPNSRSSHTRTTPRGGGIAVVLSFVGAIGWLCLCRLLDPRTAATWMLAGCTIAWIGFLDDRRSLGAKVRFTIHLIAAISVVTVLGGFPTEQLARWGMGQIWLAAIFAVLATVWSTNLFNFMDGIDGIAGSEAVFLSVAAALINWMDAGDTGVTAAWLILAAGSMGFLAWNWPPARIFMGDVGSGFIGFTIAVLAMTTSGRGGVPIEVWPILGGVFLVDATVTLLKRFWRRDRWMEPHRMHAYQHLARRLGSHRAVTLISIGVNVGWLFPWALAANRFPHYAQACLATALIPLVVLALAMRAGVPEENTR